MNVIIVLLGLAIAAAWGSADTLATWVTRSIGTALTTLIAQVAGLVLAAAVALALGMPETLSPHDLAMSIAWGVLLGAVAALAYLTLYRALEHGPLAIASPVVSAQGGVTLLLASLLLHEALGRLTLVFLLLVFAGVLLAASDGRAFKKLTPRAWLGPGVAFALVSLLSFGVLAFGLGEAARETNWQLSVVWTRVFSCFLLAVFLRPPTTSNEAEALHAARWRWWVGAAVVGSLDVGGLLLFAWASTTGSIGLVGMVASAYGMIPLAVGILALKERPSPNQFVGVAWLVVGLMGVAEPSPELARPLLGSAGVVLLGLFLWLGWGWLMRGRLRTRICKLEENRQEWHMFAQGGYVPLARRLCAYIVEDGLHALLPPSVVICGPLSTKPDDPGYQAACETARLVAEAGYGIITGCGGIMEAASLGARESGALGALPGTASSIWQPPEAGGERVTLEVLMRWHSIGPQLLAAASAVRAFIIFPGDLASLSELIEAAMAIEAGLLDPVPLVLYGSAFWRDLVAWMREMLACACTGNGGTARLIHLCDDPCEIAASISAC